jgi:putative metallohydrolase (TIGR04338 family)
VRDTQRRKIYDAERAAFRMVPGVHRNSGFVHDKEQFPDLDSVRAYVIKVCSSKRVQAKYKRAVNIAKGRVQIHNGGGTRNAMGGFSLWDGAHLNFPLWSRNEPVIIHELAHALTQGHGAAHGWQFAECMLYLTLIARGRENHDKLKSSYKTHRVRWTPPKAKRELTPEQRAACVERLRTYREQKAATPQ